MLGKAVSSLKLLTKQLREKLPPLGATEDEEDPMVICKFFDPASQWTWYAIEFDGEDVFFGWVIGFFAEFGTFSLKELQEVRGPLRLGIERDKYFEPQRLSEVQRREKELRDGIVGL